MTDTVSSSKRLRLHMAATYLNMRLGIAILGLALPLVLWIFGDPDGGLAPESPDRPGGPAAPSEA